MYFDYTIADSTDRRRRTVFKNQACFSQMARKQVYSGEHVLAFTLSHTYVKWNSVAVKTYVDEVLKHSLLLNLYYPCVRLTKTRISLKIPLRCGYAFMLGYLSILRYIVEQPQVVAMWYHLRSYNVDPLQALLLAAQCPPKDEAEYGRLKVKYNLLWPEEYMVGSGHSLTYNAYAFQNYQSTYMPYKDWPIRVLPKLEGGATRGLQEAFSCIGAKDTVARMLLNFYMEGKYEEVRDLLKYIN